MSSDPVWARRRESTSGANWGRWGPDDDRGAINLVTSSGTRAAVGLVQRGEVLSLSRAIPVEPVAGSSWHADLHARADERFVTEYLGFDYHGQSVTHIDALCHIIDEDGRLWNGRRAEEEVGPSGSSWGGVDRWGGGIVTRGVLADVAAFRGAEYVAQDKPVRPDELRKILGQAGVTLGPGDALVISCGRGEWERDFGAWGAPGEDGEVRRPGLHPSCAELLAETDVAIVAWDMLDALPRPADAPGGRNVHSAINELGIALIDNCDLAQLTNRCRQLCRCEFLLCVAPLIVVGASGSPVNPLAVL